MPKILIDGYNLIGIAHGNLEKARNEIIKQLQEYCKVRGHDVTIVFDGWKEGGKDETKTRSRDVTVIYSRLAENADTVIKRIISESTTPWIVVSSDHEVSDHALRNNMPAVTSQQFENRMLSALGAEGILDFEDDHALPCSRKGGSGKLSKKDRKKVQALNKL
jgi:predicted RNA-binding protein with PIN domain